MQVIDEILELLEDEKWHDLEEIAKKSGLHMFKIEIITNFLAEHDFITLDKGAQKIRLTPPTLKFLKRIKHIEKEL